MSSARTAARSDVKLASDEKPANEWTIMIFFAGDPRLSPSMTSQLKAIKDAGFQENTTVLVHYDPNERGVATTTFEINRMRKAEIREKGERGTRIGDGKDPFVRNLIEDSIPGASRSATAVEALQAFLTNGVKNHTAKHYMIFCVGHGVVVGNDFFLPDHEPESAITLKQLGELFSQFSSTAKLFGGEVELIGMHSCSMSAIEVAYQLKGAAKYLMATEGVSFVASWPYRQLLKKILNTVDEAHDTKKPVNVDELVNSVQGLCLYNSTDFMFSGLSADLCLSSLDPAKIDDLTAPLQALTSALKSGLEDPRGLELITMAHLKAQSYWQETYTDLYDFCLCLEQTCNTDNEVEYEMAEACHTMRTKLEEGADNVIIQSDFFGPLFQYSHGYSVFFPWSRPIQDILAEPTQDMLVKYENYEFTKALKDDSWLSFLEQYFVKTQRLSRDEEDQGLKEQPEEQQQKQAATEKAARNGSKTATLKAETANNGAFGVTSVGAFDALLPEKTSPALDMEKTSPALMDGSRCSCSPKNYPMKFSMSERVLQGPNPQVQVATQAKKPAPARG